MSRKGARTAVPRLSGGGMGVAARWRLKINANAGVGLFAGEAGEKNQFFPSECDKCLSNKTAA